MKLLLSISLLFSFVALADDHVESSGYEPNVAEYYVSTFKEGKDMDDMMRWAAKWNKWAEESEALSEYRSAMLVPYYHSGELPHDFVWVGISPNPEAHYGGNDYWINNGQKLQAELNTILESGNQAIYTWQRTVSETPDGQASYAVYTDCKLGEGVTSEDVYNAYYAYAMAAKELGDVAGRKMIFPGAGTSSDWDYDYVQLVTTSSIADYGKNWTNFWSEKAGDMPELQALEDLGGVCENERSYSIIPVKN
tara:strand:- start:94 stop:846 length:753 start_codon:yes stop_codon:yes gene_type:complete